MRLKSVELIGFKSFLEPTLLNFSQGTTAIVGPNGCGKSNVMDAIRWVLGEQAAGRLRGKTTEDLIYVGNDSNPAAGMAEVSLTMESDDARSLPEPYAQLNEVCVTRRAYRSGDSEYLINRVPCRLKDITELFMAAGVHSRSYALVEQGRVEEIVQAKPEQLRTLIEEAAGLALFNGRRELSERKLERTRENLGRVTDVLSEIQRQLSHARHQAKKAETYRAVRAELNELERLCVGARIAAQQSAFESARKRTLDLEAALADARRATDEAQEALGAQEQSVRAIEGELAAERRERENLGAAMSERSRSRDFLARRLDALTRLEPELGARVDELEGRTVLVRAARAEAGARLAREVNESERGLDATLAQLEQSHRDAGASLKAAENEAEELRDQLTESVREAAVLRSRLANLSGEKAELSERRQNGATELEDLRRALEASEQALEEVRSVLEARRSETAGLEETVRAAAQHEMEQLEAATRASAELASARTTYAAAARRAEALKERPAARRLETVMRSLNGDRPATDPPLLADVLEAPPSLAPALAAALGEDGEAAIVESPALAVRAIELLKENAAGRLTFIVQPGQASAAAHIIDAPGIAGPLVGMLEIDERYRTTVESLLGHVVVAEDIGSALGAAELNGYGTVFVTPEGDVVRPGRTISGGSLDPEASAGYGYGLPSLDEATDAAAKAQEASARAEQALQASRAERSRSEAALSQARQLARDAERLHGQRLAAVSACRERLALAQARLEDAERRGAEIVDELAATNIQLEELAVGERQLRAYLATARTEVEEHKAAFEAAGRELAEAAARAQALAARCDAAARELAHQRSLAEELQAQIAEALANRVRAGTERAEFTRELEKLDAKDVEDRSLLAHHEQRIAELAAHYDAASGQLGERRRNLDEQQRRQRGLEAEMVECELARERAATLVEELSRGFIDKFGAPFDTVAEEITQACAGRDQAADEARLNELRARLQRIGEVNLAAEGEMRELEERSATLERERQDLEAAMSNLKETVQQLSREARRRFCESFDGAARNFAEIFPKLLPGGRALLQLENPEDPLAAGVNILVQPAGKRVKEIGLLSGGEKALAALALIFSLFLLNPSPFCVMDEVDAPLDEFSLAAFTALINELKERTQFIVVTHNQRTMQRADQIHGITMEKPGLSRVISVQIAEQA